MKHSREQNREETDEIKWKGMSLRKTADGRRVGLSVGFLPSTGVSGSLANQRVLEPPRGVGRGSPAATRFSIISRRV